MCWRWLSRRKPDSGRGRRSASTVADRPTAVLQLTRRKLPFDGALDSLGVINAAQTRSFNIPRRGGGFIAGDLHPIQRPLLRVCSDGVSYKLRKSASVVEVGKARFLAKSPRATVGIS
jgi:hypothetical protein